MPTMIESKKTLVPCSTSGTRTDSFGSSDMPSGLINLDQRPKHAMQSKYLRRDGRLETLFKTDAITGD